MYIEFSVKDKIDDSSQAERIKVYFYIEVDKWPEQHFLEDRW